MRHGDTLLAAESLTTWPDLPPHIKRWRHLVRLQIAVWFWAQKLEGRQQRLIDWEDRYEQQSMDDRDMARRYHPVVGLYIP
jgi:hypothetical protein